VLLTTIEGWRGQPPKTLYPSNPIVVEPRPYTYHGSRIRPLENQNCFVISAYVFAPTSWVRRWISNLEWFSIIDIPDYFLQHLTPEEHRSFCTDISFVPPGVVFMVLDPFPDLAIPQLSNASTPACKRVCLKANDIPPMTLCQPVKLPCNSSTVLFTS
jgi:hypothetical protein